jgi:hypothetical protein
VLQFVCNRCGKKIGEHNYTVHIVRHAFEIELVQIITSEMEKEGLDINNEENLDSYLNTKFM